MDSSTTKPRSRLVVIGGGINGLAAAWSAWEKCSQDQVEILLLEASPEVGGKARTRRTGEWMFEEGPTGFMKGDAALDRLITRSGLTPVYANPEAARRYIVRAGKAREVLMGPPQFAMSGLLSPMGLLRMAREPWVPRGSGDDESVWDFAARRLGAQVADRLISPMVLGIYAGDAQRLSLPAAFPRIAELEQEYGSLFRALLALSQVTRDGAGALGPGAALLSFSEGMQSLPIALAEHASFEVRLGAAVTQLQRDETRGGWQVQIKGDDQALWADGVVLCCDAHTSAHLLQPMLPKVAQELQSILIPGLTVVGLGYSSARAISKLPRGFGALIPRGEGFRILGCLFDTQLFSNRSPEGQALVRCMIGGATDPEAVGLDDKQLLSIAIGDMQRLFRLKDSPTNYEITRWPRAIPQYELGHLERVSRIDDELERFARVCPGLHLAGCHARGVAFAKTAAEGWRVGEIAGHSLMETARS